MSVAQVFMLNVRGETAWAGHHPDSPIVRVAGDVLTSWDNRVGSCVRRNDVVPDGA